MILTLELLLSTFVRRDDCPTVLGFVGDGFTSPLFKNEVACVVPIIAIDS